MTTLQVKIVNAETGEETLRDMNANELAQLNQEIAEREALEAKANEAAEAKATAEAKLAALGLTTDDLKALGL
jgi:hypothetical protein